MMVDAQPQKDCDKKMLLANIMYWNHNLADISSKIY